MRKFLLSGIPNHDDDDDEETPLLFHLDDTFTPKLFTPWLAAMCPKYDSIPPLHHTTQPTPITYRGKSEMVRALDEEKMTIFCASRMAKNRESQIGLLQITPRWMFRGENKLTDEGEVRCDRRF